MSALEDSIRSVVREIVREEVAQAVPQKARPLLTAEQAGELLGLDKQSVYRLAREGQLKAVYVSESRFRFHPNEIERFIKQGGVQKSCLKEVPLRKVSRRG